MIRQKWPGISVGVRRSRGLTRHRGLKSGGGGGGGGKVHKAKKTCKNHGEILFVVATPDGHLSRDSKVGEIATQ